MTRKQAIAGTLIAATVIAYGHCLAHAAVTVTALGRLAEAQRQGQSAPLDRSGPACENESGCICRGVVFNASVDVDQAQRDAQQLVELLTLVDQQASGCAVATALDTGRELAVFDAPAPRAGRILRAYISSLLI